MTFKQSMEKFYQCSSYNAWSWRFYQWRSNHRDDALLLTFLQCMKTKF